MPDCYRFGRFEVSPGERQVLVDGVPAPLGARAFDLLLALIQRRDRVVGKAELIDLVWPDVVVEENNLQVQVSALRKVLGPQAIATVPGRGYRFTSTIETENLGSPHAVPEPASDQAPGPGAPAPRLSNLPELLPPMYGRDDDVAQVRALLAVHRVVSIVGAGGIGKTRLAQAVASDLRDDFADGVWWIELSALSDHALVAAEVARVLGAPVADTRPPAEAVAKALRTQKLLLLLDNCEHVREAVAALVDAVSQVAPDLRVLITTQEPLKTSEEHVYRLDPLAQPSSPGLDAASRSGAVQLFVGRAQAADPRFALTGENVERVTEICRKLDGIPLALELAAARLPLLGLEGLRARLDERFRILTGGSRFVLRRHQTLRTALDFSHGLLSPGEQAVFRRMGVFAGSFSLDGAQEVAADDRIDTWAVLDHLGALVDKSMVMAEGGQHPRLRLLETTRAYALEKLADAGETGPILERHARATARLVARMCDEFWRLSDEAFLSRYEPELDNVRAALAWSLDNDPELAIALAGDSRPLWLQLALQPEAIPHCEAALARLSAQTPQRAAGRLWYALGSMLVNARPAQSRDACARAAELLRAADDAHSLAAALGALAMWSNAPPTQQQAVALEELQRMNDPQWPARMRMLLPNASGRFHRSAGRYEEARRCYASTRDLAAACGAIQWELAAQDNVADLALIMGDVDLAVATFRAMVLRMAPLRHRLFYAFARAGLATALLFRSEPLAAREALAQAAPLLVQYDLGWQYATTAALLAAQERRWRAAGRLLGYGEASSAAHGVDADDPVAILTRNRALQLLSAHLRNDEIDALARRGALLSLDEAYRLALATEPDRD